MVCYSFKILCMYCSSTLPCILYKFTSWKEPPEKPERQPPLPPARLPDHNDKRRPHRRSLRPQLHLRRRLYHPPLPGLLLLHSHPPRAVVRINHAHLPRLLPIVAALDWGLRRDSRWSEVRARPARADMARRRGLSVRPR